VSCVLFYIFTVLLLYWQCCLLIVYIVFCCLHWDCLGLAAIKWFLTAFETLNLLTYLLTLSSPPFPTNYFVFRTGRSLTATSCDYLSKHLHFCDSSRDRMNIFVYFVSFWGDKLFLLRPGFVPPPSPVAPNLVDASHCASDWRLADIIGQA